VFSLKVKKMSVKEVNELFCKKGLTLGSVESFTGGLFAKEITAVSGASKFYKGGLVTYATEEKHRLLDISYDVINKYGVVSKEVAELMAKNAQKLLGVDCCVSFTGNAGPEAMENKPVGEVYIGIAIKDRVEVFAYHLSGERNQIQGQGVALALEILEKNI